MEVGDAWYSIWFWKRKRRGIFRCKSDRNERSGLFVTLIVHRTDRSDTRLDIDCWPDAIVRSLDFISTSIERIGSIETVGIGYYATWIPSVRYRANNSPPCRKCGRCSKKRRRRGTASWYTALSIMYLFERLYERYDFYGGERPMKLKLAKANRLEIIRLERN